MKTWPAALLCLIATGAVADDIDIALYPAFASEGADAPAVIEGRLIERSEHGEAATDDSKLMNAGRNLDLLTNDEIDEEPVMVRAGSMTGETESDDEGYFRWELKDAGRLGAGWCEMHAESVEARARGALLVVPLANTVGLISDLDDTILITEVNSKKRMLANTLFGNPTQRLAVPGAAQLYQRLISRNPQPDASPLFYLSASPRQLHGAIQSFLDHNEFPRGVLITKRVTNDRTSEPWTDQAEYKLARIQDILERTPHVRYTLIGDDGERDPEIYDEARRRWPGRIDAIWIRRVNPDPARARLPEQGDLTELLSGG